MHASNESHVTGIPHVFTTLFCIIILAALATWIVPSGRFDLVVGDGGAEVIQPQTYKSAPRNPFGPMDTLSAIHRGMTSAADVVFFIFVAFASIAVAVKTGAFHALIAQLLRRFQGRWKILVIPMFITLIGVASSTISVFEEMFPFIPIFVGVAIAMRFDALVGMGIVSLGIALGYSGSFLNPFTVGIAQNIAGLTPFSGALYRIFCHFFMIVVASAYIMLYASRISRHPEQSPVRDVDLGHLHFDRHAIAELSLTRRQTAVLVIILVGIGMLIWGMRNRNWYFEQITAVYLFIGIGSGLAMGWSPDKIAHKWAESAAEITSTCLKIAMAKGIITVLRDGNILDTIIFWFSEPLALMPRWVAAEAMLFFQTAINFFVPSGPGQAVVSMPIMVPISDVLGISRQTAVLAFQFGDGLSNILWLTGSMPIICKFARVPPRKWLRWFFPLFCLLLLTQMICIAGALVIGY